MTQEVMTNITSPEQEAIKQLEKIHTIDESERMGVKVTFSLATVEKTSPGHAHITPYENGDIDVSSFHFEGSSETLFRMKIGRHELNERSRKQAKHMSRDHGEIVLTPTGEVEYIDKASTFGSELVTSFGVRPEKQTRIERNRSTSVLIPLNTYESTYIVMHIEVAQKTKEQLRFSAQRRAAQKQAEISAIAEKGKNIPTERIEQYAKDVRDAAPEEERELYERVVTTIHDILDQREEHKDDKRLFRGTSMTARTVTTSENVLKYLNGIKIEQLEQEIQDLKRQENTADEQLINKLEALVKSLKPHK